MPWEKGHSGNPGGRSKAKPYADALRIAIMAADEDGTKLRRIAERHVEMALSGDMAAIKEIGDRLDGKPAQESTVTIEDKRDADDWTRDELVAIINDAYPRRGVTPPTNGSGGGPDKIH